MSGVTLADLNRSERYFLKVMDYRLYIAHDEFAHYYRVIFNVEAP
jgi:hypothetical protein